MTKKLILPIAIAALATMGSSCNSTNETLEYELSSSVQVTDFHLIDNEEVLDSLSNVFFAIDLLNGNIFNADSLPYGTDVSRVIPKISMETSVSAATLTYPRIGMSDTTVNYLTNSTDSIDFSKGPVKLSVTSQNGAKTMVYEIKVNVHQVKPDTLAWSAIEMSKLPSSLSSVRSQRTVELGGIYYCLTSDGTDYSLAVTDDPDNPQWDAKNVAIAFNADVESFRATDDALYILDADSRLFKSTDGKEWTSTGESFHSLYGKFGNELIACKQDNADWKIISYPSGKMWSMPDNFPVEGATLPLTYNVTMGFGAQLVMLGGKDAQGKFLSEVWGFDGNMWASLSSGPRKLPINVCGASLSAYDMFEVPTSTWRPVRYPALILIGGMLEDGKINDKVYVSKDWGLTWDVAPVLMQLPKSLPIGYDASSFVYVSKMSLSRSANTLWNRVDVRRIPPFCKWEAPMAASRVDKPITEWECPAIYIVGGKDASGNCLSAIWRGQILRYSFPPKY